jgi:hypothetical protein
MSDIFISYNNKDKAKADLFAKSFEREGWSVFWDKAIPPGKRFDQYINEQLEAAKCIVVLWSEGSVNSDWVKEEAQRGVHRKILVPVFISRVTPPLGFGRIEAAELFDWEGATSEIEFQNLLKAIEAFIPRHTGEVTLAERTPGASVGTPLSNVPVTSKKPSVAPEPRFTAAAFLKNKKYVFGGFAAVAILVLLFAVYRYLPINRAGSESKGGLIEESSDKFQNIRVWKIGSPHEGDTPDSTAPFELQREAKEMGFKLSVEGFPAKGFAAKFFQAVEKHEEPDILVIDNYGIIDGITTDLGSFTGIGKSSAIRNSLLFVTDSLKEFESDQRGWQILISTSKNHEAAKALAIRQPHCNSDFKETVEEINANVARDLQRYVYRYILDKLDDVRPGSNLNLMMCGFWGNENVAFLNTTVNYETKKDLGWKEVLVIMEKKNSSWGLLNLGGNVDLITELNKEVNLVNVSPDKPLQNNLKIIGPPDGTESTRTSKPTLEWEWNGDVESIACYLLESQFDEGSSNWSASHFKLILPEKNVKLLTPFGVGAQPHRWKVWAIDKKGSIVRSSWSTINYTN